MFQYFDVKYSLQISAVYVYILDTLVILPIHTKNIDWFHMLHLRYIYELMYMYLLWCNKNTN